MPKICATVLLAAFSAAVSAAAGVAAPAQPASAQKADAETSANCDAQIKQLLEKNPFAPAGVSAASSGTSVGKIGNAAPKGLQLNGIYCVDGAWYFALSDTVQKRSYTVKLGEKYSENSPYAVDFFDDETNSVSISSVLGSWTLTLKERDQLTAPSVVGSAGKPKDAAKQVMQKPIIVNIQGGVRK